MRENSDKSNTSSLIVSPSVYPEPVLLILPCFGRRGTLGPDGTGGGSTGGGVVNLDDMSDDDDDDNMFAAKEESKGGQIEEKKASEQDGSSIIKKVRKYDLSITYDFYT